MTLPSLPTLQINGSPPEIAGQVCEGFICEGYAFEDEPIASANVTYLKFGGTWCRLYFEFRLIFWRTFNEEQKPWQVAGEQFVYPHTDVGASAGILGEPLDSYEMAATSQGSKVVFRFHNGVIIEIEDRNDVASYAVI